MVKNKFQPKFSIARNISECADLINKPHEDYPQRVALTEKCLRSFVGIPVFSEFDIRSMHSLIMYNLEDRGRYRNINVTVGNYIPPDPLQVPHLMQDLMPINVDIAEKPLAFDTIRSVEKWYVDFETIHPFSDGNGRVGGVVLALLSLYLGAGFKVAT